MLIPAFNPSTIAEMVSYTLHGVAMSRASGTIAAVRVVTELADAAAVVDLVDPATYIEAPDPGREIFRATLLGARAVEAPDGQIAGGDVVGHDLRLGAKPSGGLGAVDPDVLGLVNHGVFSSCSCCPVWAARSVVPQAP